MSFNGFGCAHCHMNDFDCDAQYRSETCKRYKETAERMAKGSGQQVNLYTPEDVKYFLSGEKIVKQFLADHSMKQPDIPRCATCGWFDTKGFEACDPDHPELQDGYCMVWKHDVQACDYCSKHSGK